MEAVDRIERVMTLDAPREAVWAALTEPDQLRQWFGTKRAELDLRPGGTGVFGWEEGEARVTVETVEPPERFAYRWIPGSAQTGEATTLVEFTLEEDGAGTKLTLVESGFVQFPAEARRENEGGWDEELSDLRTYVAAKVPAV
jgi:uncharacterized protein YndB with AHSA1/START domain